MVSTRRGAAAGPSKPVTIKRRLRSAKDNKSPLQALPASPKRKKSKARTPSLEPESEDDPGAGIFFQEQLETKHDLLRAIEEYARPATPVDIQPGAEQSEHPELPSEAPSVDHPATPPQPEPAPRQEGFISRLWSTVRSSVKAPFTSTPATSPAPEPPKASAVREQPTMSPAPTTPKSSTPPDQLTMTLTPTPTPVGESRSKSRTKRTKNHRQAMIRAIAESITDSAERTKAEIWAKDALAKLPKNSAILGEKRKRLENGTVKVRDLKDIGIKPWKSGYGIDPDIDDLSDDEDAPAWAVLREMLLEEHEEKHRPMKKRKATHEVATHEVPSLNDSFVSAPSKPSPPKVINTHGNSASLLDVRPRPSRFPSPMFDTPVIHQQGGNVFSELQGQTSAQNTSADSRAALDRGSPRQAPTSSSGSFSVPDSDSEEDEMVDEGSAPGTSSLWTQQPPPPPVPAHASLPAPLTGSPSIPQVPSHLFGSTTQPKDAVELQRAKLMKHTPARPSRLRETHVPSPSLKSDAGNESLIAGSPVVIAEAIETAFSDIPDGQPLDLPPDIEADVQAYVSSEEYKSQLEAMAWEDPILEFSDVDAGFDEESD